MLTSYLSAALRAFVTHKQHFLLNVFGLAVGLAAAILMALFARFEASVDAHQPHFEHTYRLSQHFREMGVNAPITNYYAAQEVAKNGAVEDIFALKMHPRLSGDFSAHGNYYKMKDLFATGTNITDFVTLDVLFGDLQRTLSAPNRIALSEHEAIRIFGQANAIGETLSKGQTTYTVTAVFADLQDNTHFAFSGLVAMQDENPNYQLNNFYVYVRFAADADIEAEQARFAEAYPELVYPDQSLGFVTLSFEHLPGIHLHSNSRYELKENGSYTVVLISFSLSILLIVLAAFNFINMSIAQSAKRAKEVGVRKALGASKAQIINQFLVESLLVTSVAAVLACALLELALPAFNQLVGRTLVINYFSEFGIILVAVVVSVGVLAGAYPAFFMSAFSAKRVLSGDIQRGRTAILVRKLLLTLQASLSIALIIGAFSLHQQLSHLQSLAVGYEKQYRLEVDDIPARQLYFKHNNVLSQRINAVPGVISSSITDASFTSSFNTSFTVTSDNGELNDAVIPFIGVGFNIAETAGLEVIAGRDLSADYGSDWHSLGDDGNGRAGVLVSQSFVKVAGYESAEHAIGKVLYSSSGDNQEVLKIMGVINDVTIGSAREASASPLILVCGFSWANEGKLIINFEPSQLNAVKTQVQQIVSDQLNVHNADIELVADNYRALYKNDERVSTLVAIFCILAILLTCLGTFGLAAFSTLRRQKEVAVRKVLGASRLSIVNLLAKEFLLLVAISTAIAFPLTYWLVGDWLANFNERIDQAIWFYVVAAALVAMITWLTVASLAFRAASTRPSLTLRYE
ncbi:ABC transporter permease [Pseudoalteromonas ruthenica]|uniref:ABC transporter permease n=1 Tax=Pseudoalteromonas ruthenica TaxID=151081 RepID=UPI00110B7EF5|nr:ABC transporter permease [Pseudoalteromonas ruthenica]TMO46166.1 ABC transporter permease [Pseudoalteromonas ruthenica]TMO51589.1 ABC transporter permease [Pseudoalteromonas ruthenica]